MSQPAENRELVAQGDPRWGLIWINPARMSGEPCFHNSRVPIRSLWDYLEGGHDLDTFLDHFPGVTREQAVGVLNLAKDRLNPPGQAA